VSIARAVLKNPRILILDEATSSVDTETERKIQEAMDRLVAGRTVFAIAHRLSTLRRASRLLVIEDGNLVEHGTHAELLANPSGIYTKLHRLQQQLHDAA
jgi:ATP-binding cassette subfamily B protein